MGVLGLQVATFVLMMWPRASVCAERITEVLDTEPSVRPPSTSVARLPSATALEIRGAEFRYPGADQPVLSGITARYR